MFIFLTSTFLNLLYYINKNMALPPNKTLNARISITQTLPFGNGSTGTVYLGLSHHPETHPVAIKAIPLKEVLNNQVTTYLLHCELEALKKTSLVRNGSIVQLEEIIVKDEYCYIVMELLQGGTLKDYISRRKKLSEEEAVRILHHLLIGYRILKNSGIVHRDLKPDNIMFEVSPEKNFTLPKIIDFGYCKMEAIQPKPRMFYNVGSPRYMSPEAYMDNLYTQKSDIWSLGIVFYQMVTGTTFDKGKNIIQTFNFIKEKGIPIPPLLSSKTKTILQKMLMLTPTKRCSCEEMLQILDSPPSEEQRQLGVSRSEKKLGMANFGAKRSANFFLNQTEVKKEEQRNVLQESTKVQTPSYQFGKISMKIPITFNVKAMNTCASDRKIEIQKPVVNSVPTDPKNKPISVENKLLKMPSENIKPIENKEITRTARIVTLPHIQNPINLHSSEKFTRIESSHPPQFTPKQSNEGLNFSQKIFPKTIYSEMKGERWQNRGPGWTGQGPAVFINKRLVTKKMIGMESKK